MPGLLTVTFLSTYYEKNPVTGRYRFVPLDPSVERQVSRKLLKTWGQKMMLRGNLNENKELEEVWNQSKKLVGMTGNGKLHYLDTDEFVLQVFHTGDAFVSKAVVKGMSEKGVREVFMHQAAHVVLKHAQENLVCSKVMAVFFAYLCRENHHFHYALKYYQLFPRFTQVQEDEANLMVSGLFDKFNPHVCAHSVLVSS